MSFLSRYKSHLGLLSLIFIAFISLGMPDGLLGVAWPSIQYSFSVPIDSLGMLLIAGTSGYLISSFSSGPLTSRFGIGWVLAASCFLTGFGLIGYTLVPTWWGVVALGVVAGLGAGAIDSGLNTYVAGHFVEGLMQWLHASYGIGVTLGPLVMTLGLTRFDTWRWGYAVVGTAQIALAAVFVLTLSVWKNKGECPEVKKTDQPSGPKTSVLETLKQPIVWLSTLLFFLYCGAEGTMGYWTYSILTESRGITPKIAGLWAGSYWAMFTIGRIAAGLYTRRVGNDNLVRFSLFAALIGAARERIGIIGPALCHEPHPQHLLDMLPHGGTDIATHYVQPLIGGDLAFLTGVAKILCESLDEAARQMKPANMLADGPDVGPARRRNLRHGHLFLIAQLPDLMEGLVINHAAPPWQARRRMSPTLNIWPAREPAGGAVVWGAGNAST